MGRNWKMESYKDRKAALNSLGPAYSQVMFPSAACQSTFPSPLQRKIHNIYNSLYTMSSIHSKFTNHTKKQTIETSPQVTQILELFNTDFKVTVMKIFKE